MNGWGAGLVHLQDEGTHFFGVLGGEVVFFGVIIFDVVELGLGVVARVGVEEDKLPGSLENGALALAFEEFPVEVVVFFLFSYGEEGGDEGEAVSVLLDGGSGEFANGGGDVPEGGGVTSGLAGLDFSRPPGDHGNADAALVEVAFSSAEGAAGVEAFHLVASFTHGAVVAGEHDEGVVGDTEVFEFFEDQSDVVVHVGDHGGEGGSRFTFVGVVRVAFALGEWFLVENGPIFCLPFFFGAEAGVGDLQGEVEEKGAVFLLFEILEGFGGDDGGAVVVAFVQGVVGVEDFFAIPPEVVGVVEVGGGVGGVSEEVVEAFLVHEGGVVGVATESGFSDEGSVVSDVFEGAGEDGIERIGSHLEASVATNVGVAGVLAFEQAAA